MSNYCKKCGENVGYLGKIVEFIYYKIFRIKSFKHECKQPISVWDEMRHVEFLISRQRYEYRHQSLELNTTLTCFEHEKIGLIKKNNIKHEFIKKCM